MSIESSEWNSAMQEQFKFCPACKQQNYADAAACHWCGASFEALPAAQAKQYTKPKNAQAFGIVLAIIIGLGVISWIYDSLQPKRQKPNDQTPVSSVRLSEFAASPSSAATTASGERMVLDNAEVTVYVECTHREWRKYKIHFIIKKPGSPLLGPILRQAGNPRAYSVVVNGVDTDDDFAFSPDIAAFNSNGELIPATFVSRPLNGNEALGYAYHDLIVKYERGN